MTTAILSRKRSGSFAFRNSSQASPSSRAESCWFMRARLGQRPHHQQEQDRDREDRHAEDALAVARARRRRPPARASTSSVPETIASASPPRIPSRTAPFESSRRRQITNAISSTAKTSPAARRAVSSGGKIEARVTSGGQNSPESAATLPPLMRVLILGGDGYLGWPTAMRFSARGHEVSVVDNFSRRRWVEAQGSDSLTPILPLEERIAAWKEVSDGKEIASYVGSIEDAEFLERVIIETKPEAIIHYGEQPSAPYSMASREQAVETQQANVIGNLNLLFFMRDHVPDAHLVKLGTMGEYGTPNIDIEEGYIEIEHKGRKDTLPFPKLPGSLYHLSKVHDSHNIHFACRIWGLRATDLNQGVVYGIETDETARDPRLVTRFDYDGASAPC